MDVKTTNFFCDNLFEIISFKIKDLVMRKYKELKTMTKPTTIRDVGTKILNKNQSIFPWIFIFSARPIPSLLNYSLGEVFQNVILLKRKACLNGFFPVFSKISFKGLKGLFDVVIKFIKRQCTRHSILGKKCILTNLLKRSQNVNISILSTSEPNTQNNK